MQEINTEFEEVFQFLKHEEKNQNKPVPTETAGEYKRQFYTQNGWQGDRYDSSLRVKDITKIMRDYVKRVYPTFKFSIRKSNYSSIYISMTQAPVDMFIAEDLAPIIDSYGDPTNGYKESIQRKYTDVNYYYISENKIITEYAKKILTDIHEMLMSYHYDDSDSQIDYFDTNFYENLSIGTWDKPLEIVEKVARVTGKKEACQVI